MRRDRSEAIDDTEVVQVHADGFRSLARHDRQPASSR